MKRFFAQTYLWLLLAMLYAPIVIIAIFSFTEAKVLGNWTGFSTKLYTSLFTGGVHHSLLGAIENTLIIALVAASISTLLGSVAAIGIFNLRNRQKMVMNALNNLPMLNPDIVTAIGFMLFFTSLRIKTGFATMVLAHIAFCIPYVILSVMPKLRTLDPNLAEAALDLGCTPLQALWKVIIPQIMPGIISGALVAFSMSFDDFVISLFTTGPGVNNISIYVYASVKRINPTINALSAIIVYVITIVLILVNVIPMIRERKKKKNGN
jgi:spermidine/putrescine transport system permease protein